MFDLDTIDGGEDDFQLLDAKLDAILEEYFLAGVTCGIIEIDGVELEYTLVLDFDDYAIIVGMSSEMCIYS